MRKIYLVFTIVLVNALLGHNSVNSSSLLSATDNLFTSNIGSDTIPKKRNKKDNIAEDIKRLMLPVPSTFSPADSARLIGNWTIGIKFYKANCAKCHGIFGKGKDSIPNFSKEQIDDYKSGLLAQDKLNHAVMANMTIDELNAVFLFISNIKRQ